MTTELQRNNYKKRRKSRAAERYLENRDKIRKQHTAWYAANRDKNRERGRRWRAKNPERLSVLQRHYRIQRELTKPDEVKQKRRAYYLKRRDTILAQQAACYRRHSDRVRAKSKLYRERNPHIVVKGHGNRRLRINATIDNEHAIEHFIKMIRSSRSVSCYYCEKPVSGKRAHIDHVIPLARNGTHTVGNLCATCPPCNKTKHTKLVSEWKREGQQVLPI